MGLFKILAKIFYYPIRPAPFTYPVAYFLKKENPWIRLLGVKPISSIFYVIPSLRDRFARLEINFRIVEVPFVLRNLPQPPAKILDFGCAESSLALQLASLGYKVTGVDLQEYPYTHPNFTFLRQNFIANSFPDESFDCVVCVSTIEHIGLLVYGSPRIRQGDQKAIAQVHRVLKKGGKLILTTHFGKPGRTATARTYDRQGIRRLLKDFTIEKQQYFVRENLKHWLRLENVRQQEQQELKGEGVDGVILIVARR